MPRTTRAEFLADFFHSILPDTIRQLDQAKTELVQTGAWLVGLASTLLALFVSNRDKVSFISVFQGKLIVGLLGASVLCGVIQRLFLIAAGSSEASARFRLIGWLVGFRTTEDLDQTLGEWWTPQEIVDRLQRYYDLDYAFLLTSKSALAELRQVYSQIHGMWAKFDADQVRAVYRQIGEYVGWKGDKIERDANSFIEGSSGSSGQTVHATKLFHVAASALLAGSVTFAGAVVTLCVSFLTH